MLPMTLEEATKEITRIEDEAALARDGNNALTHIVFNLIIELMRSGSLDGKRFADSLKKLHAKAVDEDDPCLHLPLSVLLVYLIPVLESEPTTDSKPYYGPIQ